MDCELQMSIYNCKKTKQASQSTYALKVLKFHGLSLDSLDAVCSATLVARLLYASPCWCGAASAVDRARLQSALYRASRWGLCLRRPPSIIDLCGQADHTLFVTFLSDSSQVLRPLLPSPKMHSHNLRKRAHTFHVPL